MTKRILFAATLFAALAVGSYALAATVPATICARASDPVRCCKQIVNALCGLNEGCRANQLERCILESR